MAENVVVCEIPKKVKDRLKAFKFRKENNTAAIILKIKSDTKTLEIEEDLEDLDFDDLEDMLPDSQPRYVVLSYVHKMDDGRVTYPLCFIFVSPQGCQPTLAMMYSGSHNHVVRAADVTKVYKVRSTDELTEDFIKSQLQMKS